MTHVRQEFALGKIGFFRARFFQRQFLGAFLDRGFQRFLLALVPLHVSPPVGVGTRHGEQRGHDQTHQVCHHAGRILKLMVEASALHNPCDPRACTSNLYVPGVRLA